MLQVCGELRDRPVFQSALKILSVLATTLTLSIGFAGAAWADCSPGYGTCPGLSGCYPLDTVCCANGAGQPGSVCCRFDGRPYAAGAVCCENGAFEPGSQCCKGGGACKAGSNCWGGNGPTHCCPAGSVGYKDGGCAPAGADDYCGHSLYCAAGKGKCVFNSSGTPMGCRVAGGGGPGPGGGGPGPGGGGPGPGGSPTILIREVDCDQRYPGETGLGLYLKGRYRKTCTVERSYHDRDDATKKVIIRVTACARSDSEMEVPSLARMRARDYAFSLALQSLPYPEMDSGGDKDIGCGK